MITNITPNHLVPLYILPVTLVLKLVCSLIPLVLIKLVWHYELEIVKKWSVMVPIKTTLDHHDVLGALNWSPIFHLIQDLSLVTVYIYILF